MKNKVHVGGNWKKSGENFICRYFVSWLELTKNHYCGCVAGHSGHGSFEVEQFYLIGDEISISSIWVDFTDLVTGAEVEFESLGSEILANCGFCIDLMWEWNDYDHWCENDNLVLKTSKLKGFNSMAQDYYEINCDQFFVSRAICLAIGLTAAPDA